MKRNLNDILFDTLEEVTSANDKNISLVANKANAVSGLAKDVLEMAKLKLKIAKEGGVVVDFPELSEKGKAIQLIKNPTGKGSLLENKTGKKS